MTNLAMVGPLTTWILVESVGEKSLGGYGLRTVAFQGQDVRFAVQGPPFPGPFTYRTPTDFRWQKRTFDTNWLDIACNGNTLDFPSIGPGAAGDYRVTFNFGCDCLDQVAQIELAVIGMDRRDGLSLSGPMGARYRVDCADELGTTNWTALTNIVMPSAPLSKLDPAYPRSSRRFYRVVPAW